MTKKAEFELLLYLYTVLRLGGGQVLMPSLERIFLAITNINLLSIWQIMEPRDALIVFTL